MGGFRTTSTRLQDFVYSASFPVINGRPAWRLDLVDALQGELSIRMQIVTGYDCISPGNILRHYLTARDLSFLYTTSSDRSGARFQKMRGEVWQVSYLCAQNSGDSCLKLQMRRSQMAKYCFVIAYPHEFGHLCLFGRRQPPACLKRDGARPWASTVASGPGCLLSQGTILVEGNGVRVSWKATPVSLSPDMTLRFARHSCAF